MHVLFTPQMIWSFYGGKRRIKTEFVDRKDRLNQMTPEGPLRDDWLGYVYFLKKII